MQNTKLKASDFSFGESEIEREEISEIDLKNGLDEKTSAPLSFTISTSAAKIKIQLFDDIGENKINALMQGINNVANNCLEIDAAAQKCLPSFSDFSFSRSENEKGSFKPPNTDPINFQEFSNEQIKEICAQRGHFFAENKNSTDFFNNIKASISQEDIKKGYMSYNDMADKGSFVAPKPYDDFIDIDKDFIDIDEN